MENTSISKLVCPIHKEETVTAYCSKHDQTLCMKCLLGIHKDCVRKDSVEDIGETTKRLEKEMPQTIKTFEHLTIGSEQWTKKYLSTLELLDQTENRLVSGIKQMRIRMIEQTDRLASDALEMVNSVVEDQKTMVQRHIDQLEELDRKVKGINRNVERCKSAKDNGVGEMLHVVKTVKTLNSEFEKTELIDRDLKLHFYISEEVQYMRNNLTSFGELCVEDPHGKNTGMRSRPSRVSLAPSVHMDSFSDDEIDSSVFVLPAVRPGSVNDQSVYCSIHVEPVTTCPKPPPLPDMHPEMPIAEKLAFDESRRKFQTLPRMKTTQHPTESQNSNYFYNDPSTTIPLSIPPLPKKRSDQRLSGHTENTEGELDNISNKASLSGYTTDNGPKHVNCLDTAREAPKVCGFSDNPSTPEIKLRPPTVTEKLVQMFERKGKEDPNKLSIKTVKGTNSSVKRVLAQTSSNSDMSVNSLRDSGVIIGDADKIPPLPKMHRSRFSRNKRINSLSCSENEDGLRHSDNECILSNFEISSYSQKASSLIDIRGEKRLSVAGLRGSSDSSMDSCRSYFSDGSSNTSLMSSESKYFDSSVPEEPVENKTQYVRKKQTQMRIVPPLDTASRKSVTFNLLSNLTSENSIPKSPTHSQHSTITGVAVTNAGMLLICDTENNCLQLFDISGSPLYDYRIKAPYSCCTVRDEVIAVTSSERKSLCIFDISDSKIACQKEQIVSADTEVLGVGYSKGFFGVCCGDRVAILTESLQPYRMVKPVVMFKKKRSKVYFVEVRYIAMDWSKLGFFIYTSENKIDRVSCVVVGSRDRPVWNCHVGKPKSLVICKENIIVAAKHKLVVLEAASGQRLREIHHEVPTHPMHMVLLDEWLYISKTSSSNAESRNIRKISLAGI